MKDLIIELDRSPADAAKEYFSMLKKMQKAKKEKKKMKYNRRKLST